MFIVLNLLIHSAFSCSYSCESHYCLFFKGKIYCGVGEVEGSDRAGTGAEDSNPAGETLYVKCQ